MTSRSNFATFAVPCVAVLTALPALAERGNRYTAHPAAAGVFTEAVCGLATLAPTASGKRLGIAPRCLLCAY
jgi:hypothetical protein